FAGAEKLLATARGEELDTDGGYEGVRVMTVTEYATGRPALETVAWLSPQLRRVTRPESAPSGAELAPSGAKVSSKERPEIKQAALPPAPAKSATIPIRPSAGSAVEAKLRPEKLAIPLVIGAVTGAAVFIPLTAVGNILAAKIGIAASAEKGIVLAGSLLVMVCVSGLLTSRAHRRGELFVVGDRPGQSAAKPVSGIGNEPLPAAAQRASLPPIPSGTAMPTVPTQDDMAKVPAAGEPLVPPPSFTEQHRRDVLEFLAATIVAIKDEVPRLNQHVSFGINLFISGAAERYASESKLTRMQSFVLIREGVEALGNSPDRVDAFCRHIVEYKTTDRYNMMIEAGRRAMERYLANSLDPFHDFAETIKIWSSDAAVRALTQGIVCIMFTDLVGSTVMTQERGDYGAQEVVRTHNAIVRTALADQSGREVKHTGDGIMASFPTVPAAVRAAARIQRDLARHNAQADAVPVRVRIGLNAGEAVQEEDDFFGTTVQLAARVCDKAAAGEVFVTDNVRVLSQGQGLEFEDAGQYPLKGIPQPVTLYRVLWLLANSLGEADVAQEPALAT
ncbi:MAG: hypothetical protein O2944_11210, partial [Proteobacteria bacterium]|nr:hypothetical protein [Pseudomonadota bacterium]